MQSYEELLADIEGLPRPKAEDQRRVLWLGESSVLGVTRTPENRLEVFVVGRQLEARSDSLRRALEHGDWYRDGVQGVAFTANRLRVPAAPYADQVAAFVCAELLRAGIEDDYTGGFRKSEPILEFVIDRLGLSDRALLGMFGELLLFDALVRRASVGDVPLVVDAWHGWKTSLRDFVWGALGVEVKTTTRASSSHELQGLHQIDVASDSSANETGLMLLSIGAAYTSPHESSLSISSLVDSIGERLRSAGAEDKLSLFTARVREYFAEHGLGYDHATMSDEPAFSRPIEVIFVRGYDVTDPAISVLRRDDLAPFDHVNVSSVRYTVELPVTVTGDLNPVVGLQHVARRILGY